MTPWSKEQLVELNLDAFLSLYKVENYKYPMICLLIFVTFMIYRKMSFHWSLEDT